MPALVGDKQAFYDVAPALREPAVSMKALSMHKGKCGGKSEQVMFSGQQSQHVQRPLEIRLES